MSDYEQLFGLEPAHDINAWLVGVTDFNSGGEIETHYQGSQSLLGTQHSLTSPPGDLTAASAHANETQDHPVSPGPSCLQTQAEDTAEFMLGSGTHGKLQLQKQPQQMMAMEEGPREGTRLPQEQGLTQSPQLLSPPGGDVATVGGGEGVRDMVMPPDAALDESKIAEVAAAAVVAGTAPAATAVAAGSAGVGPMGSSNAAVMPALVPHQLSSMQYTDAQIPGFGDPSGVRDPTALFFYGLDLLQQQQQQPGSQDALVPLYPPQVQSYGALLEGDSVLGTQPKKTGKHKPTRQAKKGGAPPMSDCTLDEIMRDSVKIRGLLSSPEEFWKRWMELLRCPEGRRKELMLSGSYPKELDKVKDMITGGLERCAMWIVAYAARKGISRERAAQEIEAAEWRHDQNGRPYSWDTWAYKSRWSSKKPNMRVVDEEGNDLVKSDGNPIIDRGKKAEDFILESGCSDDEKFVALRAWHESALGETKKALEDAAYQIGGQAPVLRDDILELYKPVMDPRSRKPRIVCYQRFKISVPPAPGEEGAKQVEKKKATPARKGKAFWPQQVNNAPSLPTENQAHEHYLPKGLSRWLYQTCYANSILQQLFMHPQIRQLVLEERTPPNFTNGFLSELKGLFLRLIDTSDSFVFPRGFLDLHQRAHGDVDVYQQQDAQEFIEELAALIDFELVTASPPGSLKPLLEVRFENDVQVPLSWLLKISADVEHGSLSTSLAMMRDNGYRIMQPLPPTIVIRLVRYDAARFGEGLHKSCKYYEFDDIVNLRGLTAEGLDSTTCRAQNNEADFEYCLSGVVVHLGESMNSGHYYSIIRNRFSNEGGTLWYKFDDENVQEWNIHGLKDECFGGEGEDRTATLLFYDKVIRGDPSSSPCLGSVPQHGVLPLVDGMPQLEVHGDDPCVANVLWQQQMEQQLPVLQELLKEQPPKKGKETNKPQKLPSQRGSGHSTQFGDLTPRQRECLMTLDEADRPDAVDFLRRFLAARREGRQPSALLTRNVSDIFKDAI